MAVAVTLRREGLARRRLDSGLTQEELAELTGGGVSAATISRAEKGWPVRNVTAARILIALGVDLGLWGDYFPEHFPPQEVPA